MTAEVAVVGGGPAGALTAMLLAGSGRDVILLERAPAWRWRACGVFTSPASIVALRRAGLGEAELAAVARPIPAMRVETASGTSFRLTYGGSGALADSAVGFDRQALDTALLRRASAAGVDVRVGEAVTSVDLPKGAVPGRIALANGRRLEARVVIGADGLRSLVARAARVDRPSPLGRRVALTFHVPDPAGDAPHDARMIVIDHGYVGLAPVPGGRVNVGIVLGSWWLGHLRREGAVETARRILEEVGRRAAGDHQDAAPLSFDVLDRVEGASPLGHRVARRAGPGWLLAGDAAGFLDPFTGEGLHRAIVSGELAAGTVEAALAGGGPGKLLAYDRAMRARFGTKDVVSRIVQAFLSQPRLFDYAARRLAGRDGARETMGRVIGDLEPPSTALSPRYLAALLRP